MAFGILRAILGIQIVSAFLSGIMAGLGASPDEISSSADVVANHRSRQGPPSGFLTRMMSTRVLVTLAAGVFAAASYL